MVMAAVVLGNAAGLAANIAAAVHVQRAAEAASTASALFAANSTQAARESIFIKPNRASTLHLHCSRAVVLRGCCAAAHCCCVCCGGSGVRPRHPL
jgi:hypothetical protein